MPVPYDSSSIRSARGPVVGVARLAVALTVLLAVSLGATSAALAGQSTPEGRYALTSFPVPASFSAATNGLCLANVAVNEKIPGCDSYQTAFTNVGSVPADGSEIVLTDTVPAGLTIQQVHLTVPNLPGSEEGGLCEVEGNTVRCGLRHKKGALPPDAVCRTEEEVIICPRSIDLYVYFTVEPGAEPTGKNEVSISGGGIPAASTSAPEAFDAAVPFGAYSFTSLASALNGESDTQAGGHPNELTTRIDLNTSIRLGSIDTERATSIEDPKDIAVDLPIGFLGSATATPRCTLTQLDSLSRCPKSTQVGSLQSLPRVGTSLNNSPVYNIVPETGVAAEFGVIDNAGTTHVLYANVVPTANGYVLRTVSNDLTQINFTSITATFYGDPAEKQAELRQLKAEEELREKEVENPFVPREVVEDPIAMFTNPTHCATDPTTGEPEPLTTTVHLDSWQHPGATYADGSANTNGPGWVSTSTQEPGVTGCNLLHFEPSSFSMLPDTATADSATGMTFDLKLPQPETPGTLATPPLRDATVTLPAGVIVNPASAGGLASCTESQIGWLGGSVTNFNPEQPTCPKESEVGSVELSSPLVSGTLVGTVYLAAQNENPFHSLLAGYIVVNDPTTGTLVKIAGELKTNPSTGQITGTFDENPQLPFSELKLRFFGGVRGELATPESCGTFTTTSNLLPWSAENAGEAVTPSSSFPINAGCAPGFGPAFTAGTTNPQAGTYAPFTLTFSRGDTEQELSGLTVTLPPGLVGKLAGITQCSDAQLAAAAANPSGAAEAANPECPANSRIGSVQSSAGVGSEPFTLGGTAYLTGGYKGAPYGVAVVVPAVAGPLDIGNVVVRAKLEIDPTDAHVTVTSDPFPTIVDAKGQDGNTDGFPIRLRSVTVTMDRPGFTLNPTNCAPLRINATLTSTAGASAAVGSQFQAGNCANLAFKDSLAATVAGKASKAGGASLDVKVIYPSGPLGTYANIKSVKVDLPKQLPSRLTTLQKACLAATFEANPANCSPESDVGMAVATTPLLSNPLMGPAYLVSHGNEAFPDLEIVLQGEGIKLILDGNTKIKNGITSSTFKTVPDAPVSSFDLKLPTGKFSILGANVPQSAHYSLCGQKLAMPTEITGQNGAVLKQSTKIGISGCAKHKVAKKHHKAKKGKKTRKG